MKRKILLGLTIMLCCFYLGGIYIIVSTGNVTDKLERVITFQQVELLRETLENRIKVVQSDLLLQGSEHARSFDTMVDHVESVQRSAVGCKDCHHNEATNQRLEFLEEQTEEYLGLLSRTLTLRANQERLEEARMQAYNHGESLINTVGDLSALSSERISERISQIKFDITATRQIIVTLVIVGPLALLAGTAFFMRRYAGAIGTLVTATERLGKGDLSYQIDTPLTDEFKLLAEAFNRMVVSLRLEKQNVETVQRLYQALFESAGEAICILETEPRENLGLIISINQAASDMYGYSVDELQTMNCLDLSPEEEHPIFMEKLQRIFDGEWVDCGMTRIRKDGSRFPTEISAGPLLIDQHKYILTFARDITEREQAQKELLHANQMAIVGQMAVGLAHEIKNPLAGIKATIEVLADDLELEERDQDLFQRVIKEVVRMEQLLRSLLNYARPPQPHFDLLDLNRLLDQTVKNVEVTAAKTGGKQIRFEKQFADDLHQVEADSSQLQQVFLNILLNAFEAMPGKGCVKVSTQAGENRVQVVIADDGKGMSENTLENIFNPFFTTKQKGTGLGLSICRRLIEQHGGTIDAESQVDVGTTFTISLPLQQKQGGRS